MSIRRASETRSTSSPGRQARAWSTMLPAVPYAMNAPHTVEAQGGRFGVDLGPATLSAGECSIAPSMTAKR